VTAALGAAAGWTLFAGLTLLVGAVIARWAILPRAGPSDGHRRSMSIDATARFALAANLLAIAGLAFFFLRQLLEFRDPFAPWTEDATLLLRTGWGRSWMLAVGGSVLCAGALLGAALERRAGWFVATPIAMALGTFPSLTGHAAGVERLRGLTLAADSLHVWAAGAWIGGLAVVVYLDVAARRTSPGGGDPLPGLVRAFSPVAMASVGVLVLTGSFAAWMHLPAPSALLSTGYGRTLVVKVALVLVVLGLGARNYRVLTPRLGTTSGDRSLRRSAALELIFAQAVLVATAVLVRLSPTEH